MEMKPSELWSGVDIQAVTKTSHQIITWAGSSNDWAHLFVAIF